MEKEAGEGKGAKVLDLGESVVATNPEELIIILEEIKKNFIENNFPQYLDLAVRGKIKVL